MAKIDLEKSVGLWAKLSTKYWEKVADIELRKQFGLTGSQWKIFAALAIRNGISQKEIADLIFVEAPTLVPIIDRMEKDGFVVRKPDPKDRRNNRIFLTKKSESLADSIIASALDIRKIVLKNISEKDLETTRKTLKKITENAESHLIKKGAKIPKSLLPPKVKK